MNFVRRSFTHTWPRPARSAASPPSPTTGRRDGPRGSRWSTRTTATCWRDTSAPARPQCSSASNGCWPAPPIASSPSRPPSATSCCAEHRIGRAEQYRVVPLGFDLTSLAAIDETARLAARAALGIPTGAHVVSTVGRLTAIKQHHLFLEAARLVANRDADAIFLVAGDGELRAELEQTARDFGLADRRPLSRLAPRPRDRLRRHGRVPAHLAQRRDAGRAHREPGRRRARRESTDVGGVRDVIAPMSATLATSLAPYDDAAGLAAAVMTLLGDPRAPARDGRARTRLGASRATASIGSWPTSRRSTVSSRVTRYNQRHDDGPPRAHGSSRFVAIAPRPVLHLVSAARLAHASGGPTRTDTASSARCSPTTGKFTRFPDAPPFVPEVHPHARCIRCSSPSIYKVAGVAPAAGRAGADGAVRADLPARVRDRATRRERDASRSARRALTALFPADSVLRRARDDRGLDDVPLHGVDVDGASRARSHAALMSFAGARRAARADDAQPAGLRALPHRARRRRPRRLSAARRAARVRRWRSGQRCSAAFAIAMVPWFTYNYVTLGRFTLSPAGGVGRGLWEGLMAGHVVRPPAERADASRRRHRRSRDARRTRRARWPRASTLPAAPMLEYVHQWQDIRRIWTEPTDPVERAVARVAGRPGISARRRSKTSAAIRSAHLARRLARGVFILWAGEIPFRYSEINQLPPAADSRRLGRAGARCAWPRWPASSRCAARGRTAEALLLGCAACSTSRRCISRSSPRRGSRCRRSRSCFCSRRSAWRPSTGHSLALEPQMHEREHL